MKLEYSTIVDCGGETRYWDGDPDDAIAAAANYLGAVRTERGHIYLASETDEAFRLTRDEMMRLERPSSEVLATGTACGALTPAGNSPAAPVTDTSARAA